MTVSYLNDADASAAAPAATPDGGAQPGPREDLGRYAELGGFTLAADTHPWYAAADAIGSPEDARAASTALTELRNCDIRATRDAVAALAAEAGLEGPDSTVGLTVTVSVLQRVQSTAGKLRADVYAADLDALTAATAGARWRKQQGVKLSWGRRRTLRAQAKGLALGGRTSRSELHQALAAAAAERADWAALASSADDSAGTARPVAPADAAVLTETAQSVEVLGQAVRVLGRVLPGAGAEASSLESVPLDELAELVDRLAADEGTLYRLPTLRSLRAALSEQGLDDLLAELADSHADREAAVAAYDREVGAEAADSSDSADDDDADTADSESAEVEAARQALAAGPRDGGESIEETAPVTEAEVEVEVEVVAEVEAEVAEEPEAVVEPAVESEVEASAETPTVEVAEVEPEAAPEVVAEVEPDAEVEPEAALEVEPEVVAEVVAEVEVEPEAAPEPVLVEEEPAVVVAEAPAEAVVASVPEQPRRSRRPKKPDFTPGRPVTAYTPAELTAIVGWIDGDQVERTEDELLRAAMKELGFARLGPRIKEALGVAIAEVRA